MAVVNGSTLYTGSVSKDIIYRIKEGVGFTWGNYMKTELLVDGKPRQLTKGKHSARPLQANVKNPRDSDYAASTSTTTIDGRQLTVSELMAIEAFDVATFKNTFPEYQPTGLSVDLQANPEIRDAVFDLMMNAAHSHLNELHSVGDTGSGTAALAFYDGLVTRIIADGSATQVGTPAVLTSANIISYVKELKNAIPARLRASSNIMMFGSYEDGDLYSDAAKETQDATATVLHAGVRSITQTAGGSIPFIQIENIPKNFIFVTIAGKGVDSNLVQGVWVENDKETLKMYRSEEADQEYKLLLRLSAGVQYKASEDIFYLNNV